MILNLMTPEKKLVVDLKVDEIVIPSYRGELNILPRHSPLMTTLTTGVLSYKEAGQSEFKKAAISWGYCEVNPTAINVLANTAETAEEMDKARAQANLEKNLKKLAEPGLSTEETRKLQQKIHKDRARIRL